MQVTPLRPSILCGWFSQNMMRDSMTRCGDFVPRLIPSPKGGLRAALFRARNPLARHGGKRHKAGVTPVVNTASQFGNVRGAARQSDRGGSWRQMVPRRITAPAQTSPGGTTVNSPAIHRWENATRIRQAPQGRKNHSKSRSTYSIPCFLRKTSISSLKVMFRWCSACP